MMVIVIVMPRLLPVALVLRRRGKDEHAKTTNANTSTNDNTNTSNNIHNNNDNTSVDDGRVALVLRR